MTLARKLPAPTEAAFQTQTLELPFQTHRLNELLGNWRVAARRKRSDREAVGAFASQARLAPATGKRRVTLVVTLGPRQRGGDPDCWWKSLLDCLKAFRLITDDNRQGVELMPVEYRRGPNRAMTITLEDL